jgi:hypothetical protein
VLRFDLDGNVMPPETDEPGGGDAATATTGIIAGTTGSAASGALYHHEDAHGTPGYSPQELLLLARSSVAYVKNNNRESCEAESAS